MQYNKVYVISVFIVIVLPTLYLLAQPQIHNYFGEKLFLNCHQNNLAVKLLDKVAPNKKNYYSYFLLGRIYFVNGELYKSVENYNKSIELAPNFSQSYYGRGLAYGFSSSIFLDNAEADFKKYIELEDEEFKKTGTRTYGVWAGYNDLAWVHFLQGNFTESEKVARAGLQISPENPWLLNMLSVALIEQDKCTEAYPFIQKAKNLADKMNSEEFGEAYSGDNKKWWPKGLEEMKTTIQDNVYLCANRKLSTESSNK